MKKKKRNYHKIAWEKLEQAHGDASHIPKALDELISRNPRKRINAYWSIDNHVVLQSDLYQAALIVAPVLIEMLKEPETLHGRDLIYDLLYEIGNGWAPESEKYLNIHNELVPLKTGCREEVIKGLAIYLEEIKNIKSKARSKALELLVSFEEAGEKVLPELKNLVPGETDIDFKNELLAAIHEIEVEHPKGPLSNDELDSILAAIKRKLS